MKFKEYINKFKKNEIKTPFIIAEAGVNHEGSLDLAKRLIEEAHEGGAHAIKFQTYKAESIASKNSPYYWDITKEPTRSQFELFKKYDKFWKEEYQVLKNYCDSVGIEFMSTAFDLESADFLNEMMDVYKISSSDITNLPFIDYQCKFGKPIILSTGASNLWEIQRAVDVIEKNGNPICLMHCVLNYPTPNENAHLGMIKDLITKFPQAIPGYSDHTLPQDMEVVHTAILLGATVIEKHFTYDKTLPGNDHYHAMDINDLKTFWKRWEFTERVLGSFKIKALEAEEPARNNARRSLVAAKFIAKGKVLEKDDLTWKRPAHGISPSEIENVIGKCATTNIESDTIIKWNLLD